jgi:Zn-dependent peptidase ImmA (M78 family)
MPKANVQPALFTWALERSGKVAAVLHKRFPKLARWETGDDQPTFRELEDFAKATLTPFGAFFLPAPPEDKLPVPDYRTVGDRPVRRPSAALLETIYMMQRRQEWMRDYLMEEGMEPLPFIGTVTLASSPAAAAESIRRTLGMTDGWADRFDKWEEALTGLRQAAEAVGIMVISNGVVGNNTSQKLDVEEFRGFVLSDSHAPLVFINGADFKSAQIFTLAHELAHLWLNKDGVFNLHDLQPCDDEVERFCNKVAAELLIPGREMERYWPNVRGKHRPFELVARHFKVGPMVAARRALEVGMVKAYEYKRFMSEYTAAERKKKESKKSGGSFIDTQVVRVGRLFGGTVVRAARAEKLLYQDAYRLTGLYGKTFDQFAREVVGYTA